MKPKYLFLDYETRSQADLKSVGGYEYALNPSTEILCVAWRFFDGEKLQETKAWSPLVAVPYGELIRALCDPTVNLVAHNAFFEQVITRFVLSRIVHRPALKEIPIERWICTASLAAPLALPRKLEEAARVLGLPVQKDMAGHRLMLKMSKPRKPTKNNPAGWHEMPDDIRRLIEYCKTDVDTTVALFKRCPPLIESERKLWCLDQRMNHRGMRVDRKAVKAALAMIEIENARLEQEVSEISCGLFRSTQRAEVLSFLRDSGHALHDLTKKTVDDALKAGVADPAARRLLQLKQSLGKTSTKKYLAFEARTRSDGRARELLMYHGASTGRWTGLGIQVQNLPRPKIKNTTLLADVIADGDLETVRLLYGDPLGALSCALRSMIVPTECHTFYCGDYNAIEVRVLFWLARHDAGLAVYRADERDIYREMASAIYGVPLTKVTGDQRDVGKRAILGCVAEGTPVLTDRGWTPIEQVKDDDLIWDGESWRKHGGLSARGLKTVIWIETLNIELTPDHWVLTKNGWHAAAEIASGVDTRLHAEDQKTGALQLSPGSLREALSAVSACAAYAELKKNVEWISSIEGKEFFASDAPNLLTGKKADDPEMLAFWLIQNLENVGTSVSITSGIDVSEILQKTFRGMAVAGLNADSNPSVNFWNTLLHCAGLINPYSRWTELITTDTMSPEIYELSLKKKTTRTVQTYDLINCETKRFQVKNAIVHNCGYGMGPDRFKDTCEQFGTPVSDALAKRAISAYREHHAPVPQLWKNLERAAVAAVNKPSHRFTINRATWWTDRGFLWCELPSGRRLAYFGPEVKYHDTPWGERRPVLYHWGVDPLTKKWVFDKTWGGVLTENVTQAVARDLMAASMLRLDANGYFNVITIHDEILTERENKLGAIKEFTRLMTETPAWADGLPVRVDSWEGKRYRKG